MDLFSSSVTNVCVYWNDKFEINEKISIQNSPNKFIFIYLIFFKCTYKLLRLALFCFLLSLPLYFNSNKYLLLYYFFVYSWMFSSHHSLCVCEFFLNSIYIIIIIISLLILFKLAINFFIYMHTFENVRLKWI